MQSLRLLGVSLQLEEVLSADARAHFTACVDRYYGAPRRLERPGMMDLFAAVCEGAPNDSITEALARCADRSSYLPTPAEFRRVLQDILAGTGQRAADIPERREDCPTCAQSVRYYMAGEAWRRFSNSGGLMFRLHLATPVLGEWYAARCWDCRGPAAYRTLPIPRLENRPAFTSLFGTDGAQLYVAGGQRMAEFFDAHASWQAAEQAGAAYKAWLDATVLRTLQLVVAAHEAAQAAERPRHA